MNFFDQLLKLERIHLLINRKATGSPKYLSRKLNISERQVYRLVNELKTMGFPISYSKAKQTYFYEYEVKFFFEVRVGEDQLFKIKGGKTNVLPLLTQNDSIHKYFCRVATRGMPKTLKCI